jgi:hypothetical protein
VPSKIVTTSQANLRSAADRSASSIKLLSNNTPVEILCQRPGGAALIAPFELNSTWDFVTARVNGTLHVGYVSDMLVDTLGNGARQNLAGGAYFLPTLGIPRCTDTPTTPPPAPSTRAERAAQWAERKIGSTSPASDLERNGNAGMDRWTGWCLVFASDAFQLGAAYWSLPNGKATAWQMATAVPRTMGVPPRGAMVFYSGYGNYGHVAISLGSGKIATTQGLVNGPRQPIAAMGYLEPKSSWGLTYEGWWLPF